jgi:phage/plasmid-like protein (TIGR03299 family)
MSKETLTWLNNNTLIGQTAERGNAWHYKASEQGGESNHYPGFIPLGDVQRRLFGWEAVSAPIFAELPADIDTMTGIDSDGRPVRRVAAPGRQAIVRSDTADILGIFKDGYQIHQFDEWLLHTTAQVTGERLGITSAGLLKLGAQAWVEFSVPETMHNAAVGFDFRPNLLAATSHDGSIATTIGRTITATVCDNTMAIARGEMGGNKIKIKHSRYSHLRITEAREALAILEQTADDFDAAITALASVTVTDRQLGKFLDVWAPVPDAKGAARTNAENRREQVRGMLAHDARVSPWAGTAFGVHQAVNTWAHHVQNVRGAERAERNQSMAITGGFDKLFAEVDAALAQALATA